MSRNALNNGRLRQALLHALPGGLISCCLIIHHDFDGLRVFLIAIGSCQRTHFLVDTLLWPERMSSCPAMSSSVLKGSHKEATWWNTLLLLGFALVKVAWCSCWFRRQSFCGVTLTTHLPPHAVSRVWVSCSHPSRSAGLLEHKSGSSLALAAVIRQVNTACAAAARLLNTGSWNACTCLQSSWYYGVVPCFVLVYYVSFVDGTDDDFTIIGKGEAFQW